MTLHNKLIHAATQYDARQEKSKRGHYNRYALAQYFKRIDEVEADIKAGATPRAALIAAFSGPLLNCLLKGIGEPKYDAKEKLDSQGSYLGMPVYRPASAK